MPSAHAGILESLGSWWKQKREVAGSFAATRDLWLILREFLRDSTPERKRRRYGDIDFDWEYRVDTTAATVSWRARLMGLLNSPYQAIEPELFRKMIALVNADLNQFTFFDIGSGKGRALLLASQYRFRRIVGIELLAELNEVARENIQKFARANQECQTIETICADASEFNFPSEPLVIFLFNALPETKLKKLLTNLCNSLDLSPRPTFILYGNPEFDQSFLSYPQLTRISATQQYSIFAATAESHF